MAKQKLKFDPYWASKINIKMPKTLKTENTSIAIKPLVRRKSIFPKIKIV